MTEEQWERFKNLTDEEIQAGIDADPDAAPVLGEWFWKNARVVVPAPKQLTSFRIDPDVLTWFKSFGKGYQTRVNAVLRSYMEAHEKGKGRAAKR
jgi:uncharacterized protein (DUF4415 family)